MENTTNHSHRWSLVYKTGGIAAYLAAILLILDVLFGLLTGMDQTSAPVGAIGRFGDLHDNVWLGLYNLDLIKLLYQIIFTATFFAIYAAHRHSKVGGDSFFALVLFIIGTALFIAHSPGFPMLELSGKYATAVNDGQRMIYSAAGEAILAKGAHGSTGAFLSYLFPVIAGVLISRVMYRGGVFSKGLSVIGYVGNLLIILYLICVTFYTPYYIIAISIAIPGYLLTMVWVFLTGRKLLKLTLHKK